MTQGTIEPQPRRPTWGVTLRIFADVLMIQGALVTALAARLIYHLATLPPSAQVDQGKLIGAFVTYYLQTAVPLTAVCLLVFALMGFYTYGRSYQSRYKALVVFQAVTLAYLIFGFLTLFFGGVAPLPRSALIFAWLATAAFTIGARVWSMTWKKVQEAEERREVAGTSEEVKNVLVIGGAGYIGSALLPLLLDKGYRVRVLDLMVFGDEPIKKVARHPNLELVRGDFRHIEKVVEALSGIDSVIHLGAIVGDPACSLDEELTIDVNLSATRMIGELAKAVGVRRFLFASTCSVYGASREIVDERSVVKPLSLYGQTKAASENLLLAMASERFVPVVARFGTIYGLSGRTRFDLVVNLLAARARMERKITIFGGEQWRPFVHVEDAARALLLMLQAPLAAVRREVFNVGSNEQNLTVSEVGRLVARLVPGAEVVIEESSPDRRDYRVSFDRIRDRLGFKPAWTVELGVLQVLEAIASGEIRDYQSPQYSNVKFLSEVPSVMPSRNDWVREALSGVVGE